MAERGNTTHGPNQDDQLKHEAQGLIQGSRLTRAEEWRESETIDDGDTGPEAGDRPVYEPAAEPAQATNATGDESLTEPIADKVGNDDENDDEEAQ